MYKTQLAAAQQAEAPGPAVKAPAQVPADATEALAWVDSLANEMNENIEERINLGKAKLELQDLMLNNRYEHSRLKEQVDSGKFPMLP